MAISSKSNNIKSTKFKPSTKQIDWLRSALKPEVPPFISAIAKDCGVRRETWYDWVKKPKFVKWWNEQWEEGMKQTQTYFDKIGMLKANKDYRYWEGMQMKYHKFAKKEETKQDDNQFKELMKGIRDIIKSENK